MTGFICVNKAEGVSSAREVSKIRKLAGVPCGHMGTLDPMASGVLPVAIGNAARLFDFFLDKKKRYIARFSFGLDSDTLDITGNVQKKGFVPAESEISDVLGKFCGEIMQVPPRYSAKNVDGKRGYQLARSGVDFQLAPKKVSIYSILLLEKCDENSFLFQIDCGGGTYIRSLARDIAAEMGTYAVMSGLTRTKSGVFDIEHSVETDKLNADNFYDFIIPTDSVLPYESICASEREAKKLFNGLNVESDKPDGIYKIYCPDGSFYGLAEANNSLMRVKKKLC